MSIFTDLEPREKTMSEKQRKLTKIRKGKDMTAGPANNEVKLDAGKNEDAFYNGSFNASKTAFNKPGPTPQEDIATYDFIIDKFLNANVSQGTSGNPPFPVTKFKISEADSLEIAKKLGKENVAEAPAIMDELETFFNTKATDEAFAEVGTKAIEVGTFDAHDTHYKLIAHWKKPKPSLADQKTKVKAVISSTISDDEKVRIIKVMRNV